MKEFEKYIADKISEIDAVGELPVEKLRHQLLMARQSNRVLTEALQKLLRCIENGHAYFDDATISEALNALKG